MEIFYILQILTALFIAFTPLPLIIYFTYKYRGVGSKQVFWKLPLIFLLLGAISPFLDWLIVTYFSFLICSAGDGHCGAEILVLIFYPLIGLMTGIVVATFVYFKNRPGS